ncbi:hypothetical protein KZZ52_43730 [Dactylosporangium sp. AC04546]|uniref:hypothetical protein n=1 Tax=Dactylosporangium sp. AC04546 TaxID=2862460 RepID=UPI001EE02972|nr:hypothetical protein [Dactylosporangium sp. AC04546]WVK80826.1 hypothetical protein KZZ52_43730 [Dactylosporangium sp. AC04546]
MVIEVTVAVRAGRSGADAVRALVDRLSSIGATGAGSGPDTDGRGPFINTVRGVGYRLDGADRLCIEHD